MRNRSVAAVALLGLTLAACGDNAEQSSPPSTVSSTTVTSASTSSSTPDTTTTTTAAPESTTSTTAPGLSEESRLIFSGIGPVRVGMTLAEASAAAGKPVEVNPEYVLDGCGYAEAKGGPAGLAFMVLRDKDTDPWRIVRVDVDEGSRIATLSGIRIGATEADVKRTYSEPGRTGEVTVENHVYVEGGHYISYDDDGEGGLRMLFETDGQKVTRFRSGRHGPVGYIEGCA